MDDELLYDIHDLVIVGSNELRIREFAIGHWTVELWTISAVTGEKEIFASATNKDLITAIKQLWQECCG